MSVTANDLVLKVRREAQDWGALTTNLESALTADATTVALTNMSATLGPAEDRYCQVNLELMRIVKIGTSLTVERGALGTTAAAHEAGDLFILQPRFTNERIIEALNTALELLSSYEPYVAVSSDSGYLTASGTEEFNCPSGAMSVIRIDMEKSTAGLYRPFYGYTVLTDTDPPVIRIPSGMVEYGRQFKVIYTTVYPDLAWDSETDVPTKWHRFLAEYAAGVILENEDLYASGLNAQSTGTAPRPGQNQQVGRNLQGRAMSHFAALRPATRIISRPDQRQYRR